MILLLKIQTQRNVPFNRNANIACSYIERNKRQAWNRHYRCLTVSCKAQAFVIAFVYLDSPLWSVPIRKCCSMLQENRCDAPHMHMHGLTGRFFFIPIDQHWFGLYWFSRAQFPLQSIGKWMPFYFNLPQRHKMIYNTKAMSLHLCKELFKNSFEGATQKRSCQLTVFSALVMVVIV